MHVRQIAHEDSGISGISEQAGCSGWAQSMRRFSASDLTNHGSSFAQLFVNCRPIITVASVSVVLLAKNLEIAQVKVCLELQFLAELLVFFIFFVKDATVNALVVLFLAFVDDCLKLSVVSSIEHLLAKIGETSNSLLTHLSLKIQQM